MSQLAANQGVQIVSNALYPEEGPRAIPYLVDFTNTAEQDLDLLLPELTSQFSMIQTLYVDLSNFAAALTVIVAATGQVLVFKAHTQGYYPVLAPNPVKMRFLATQGSGVASVYLLNMPVPPVVWATQ
jgi:hypothetical protein